MKLGFMGNKGSDIIAGALKSFKDVVTKLDEGIKASNVERKDSEAELGMKRKEFNEVEHKINVKIANHDADINEATQVRDNIKAMLTPVKV